nr:PREDICTED: nardilysin-like [Bemisia tabaci]
MLKVCHLCLPSPTSNVIHLYYRLPSVKKLLHTSLSICSFFDPTMGDEKFSRLKTPRKSPQDTKEYSAIQLPNRLTALIVSDVKNLISLDDAQKISENESKDHSVCSSVSGDEEEEEEDDAVEGKSGERFAAVALTIGVGSFSDPPNIPGLAHFLEHMIFMGTEKYPGENEFDSFLHTKGGYSNASTDCEETTFYFECQEIYLEKALDYFSNYFVCPLLKQEAMTREREAVDSEFQITVSEDHSRFQQVFGSLAAPDNPAGKFMWGNQKTLKDDVSDDDLHAATVEFYKRHYSAHRMKLAIQARLPSSLLESWVVQFFSAVPTNNLPADSFPMKGLPFEHDKFHKIYTVQSTKDVTLLQVGWILPPDTNYYKEKPLAYLSWIIGHEGVNSLMAFLRSKNWALALCAGVENDQFNDNSLFTYFEITVKLSEQGVSAMNDVLGAIFSHVRSLQELGPCNRIYDEIKALADIDFRFQEEDDVASYVESLSQDMLVYPPEDFISGPDLYEKYDPELIKSYLDQMIPENAIIFIRSKDEVKPLDLEEFWFKTKYRVDDFGSELLEHVKSFKLPKSVTIPPPNNFIPSNFDLLPSPQSANPFPVKIDSPSDHFEIWYKQDVEFKMPTTIICIHFLSNFVTASPRNETMWDVFLNVFEQILTPHVYPAKMCSTGHRIYKTERGFALELEGYHDKIHLVLELILDQMKNSHDHIALDLFENIKKEVGKGYRNKLKSSKTVEKALRFSALWRDSSFDVDRIAELSNISYNDLLNFSRTLLQELKAQCLFQGNISETQARDTCVKIQSIFQFDELPKEKIPSLTLCELPVGQYMCSVQSFDKNDVNCLTSEYFQCGVFDLKSSCIIQFFDMIFEEPLFDTLRTKEQLGYDISCCYKDTLGVLGFSVTLISALDKFEPHFVESKLSSFIENFGEELKSISEEAFQESQDSLIKDKMRVFNCLRDEVKFHFDEIKSQDFFFKRHLKEAKQIKELKLSDLTEWYEKYIQADTNMLRKLVIQVVGHKSDSNRPSSPINNTAPLNYLYIVNPSATCNYKIIDDIKEFNRSLAFLRKA